MRPFSSATDIRYRERVKGWCEANIRELDDDAASDADAVDLVRQMGRAGLLKAVAPRSHGGLSPAVRSLSLVGAREEIAWYSPLADTMYAMQGLGSYPITLAGSETLKKRYLPEVVAGKLISAFALTEELAGSDAGALATTAVRDGKDYVLNGRKRFISNAGIADIYVVFARLGKAGDDRGLAAFLIEAEQPGFKVTERTELGAPHPIGKLQLSNCRVPARQRLGREGAGLKIVFRTLDTFRATVGAAACGMAGRALHETLARVQSRKQFGRPIGKFQATRFRIADMATRLEAARNLVYRAAWMKDNDENPTLAASMAKLAATESAFRIVDDAVQLHGGDGLVRGAVVERLYREVRALRIYEGTSEIQRLVIAREMLDH